MPSNKIKQSISHLSIYIDTRKQRICVGHLHDRKDHYYFEYDSAYYKAPKSIPLGPDLPLTDRHFSSPVMFASLMDRIPSKRNAAYPEYCAYVGISVDEDDPMRLLSTLGQKAASSFIIEAVYDCKIFEAQDLKHFRQSLDFSLRDFAQVFDFAYSSLARVEAGKASGKDILKRAELYAHFPKTALFQLQRNGHLINHKQKIKAQQALEKILDN